MKKLSIIVMMFMSAGFLMAQERLISAETYASYYGEAFDGRLTASGEVFDSTKLTAAHRTLPFGTFVQVSNLDNGRSVVVRINDRGPFVQKRGIDVSKAAAQVLGMLNSGLARVQIKTVPDPALTAAVAQPVPVQTAPQTTAQVAPVATAPVVVQNTNSGTVYTPTTSAQTSGPLWRIQIGAFVREENALRLVVALRKIGFEPAYEKSENYVRVVLYGIKPEVLNHVIDVLNNNQIRDYVIRQEAW